MSARSTAYVLCRVTAYKWVRVDAISLDDALDEARGPDQEPERAQWGEPEDDVPPGAILGHVTF